MKTYNKHSVEDEKNLKNVSMAVVVFLSISVILPVPAISGHDENPDKTKSFDIGDPISARTQSYYFKVPMLHLGGSIPVKFGLIHQSNTNFNSSNYFLPTLPRLKRWSSDKVYAYRWGEGDGELQFINSETDGQGSWNNGPYSNYQYGLKETAGAGNWYYLMDPSDQTVYMFEKDSHDDNVAPDASPQVSRLVYHIDRNANRVTYSYNDWSYYPDTNITDGFRTIHLITNGSFHLNSVSDGNRTYTLAHNASGHITGITDPMGQTTVYEYKSDHADSSCLTRKILPEGNIPYTQSYVDSNYSWECHTAAQTDAYNNTTTISVEHNSAPTPDVVTETRPDGSTIEYQHPHQGSTPLSIEDTQGNSGTFDTDANDHMTGITDRLGERTTMTYHGPTGFISSITNAEGDSISYTYTAQDQTFTNPANAHTVDFTFYNHTGTDYPDGTHESFAYDSKGNLSSFSDRNNQTTHYTYDAKGLLLTITNPAGGVVTYTYNSDGTTASRTDSDTGITTYSYDGLRRLVRIDPPRSGQIDMAYDLMDRLTSITDENGHNYQYHYDKNGNMSEAIDPAGHATRYAYDLMDRVHSVTDRTNHTTTFAYDYQGAVTSIADSNIQTTFAYNDRGWLESVSRNGKSRSISYDAEGVVISMTSAMGRTSEQGSDKLGHINSVTIPGGQSSSFSRDAMTRISSITDPLSRVTHYTYNNNGELTGITLADGNATDYTYNTLGKVTAVRDLNNSQWTFSYSTMGKITSITDPLGEQTRYTYNTRGWLETIDYPDAQSKTHSYDAAGKRVRTLCSDGTDLRFSYDANNYMISANDLNLSRDDEGRITESTYNTKSFGGSYDASGRVATVSYGTALSVTYSYNSDNLLSRVQDTLGNQVDFTYNDDGKPTALRRSNAINTALDWDNNGRLSRITDGNFSDLHYSYDDAGRITGIQGTWPLSASQYLGDATESFNVNSASKISNSGYSYDARGRVTVFPDHTVNWNGNDRLKTLDSVTFDYNGLNEIVSRSESGTTTRYYHNHTIGLNPVVAELKAGSITRYYVYTPSGQLLYSIDAQHSNAVAFYHTDQVGSTLALTDNSGSVTDKYAYSPYGKLLGHTGSSTQPYTYVGTLGVRQEGDLYQMRARY